MTRMGSPTQSQKRLAKAALDQYDLQGARITVLQAERQTVFGVHACGRTRYVLRVYGREGPDRQTVWSQCQWLRAIARDTDLNVPAPIQNKEGGDVTWIDADARETFCTLTRWVPGRPRFRRDGPGPAVLRQVGRIMATLHAHGTVFRTPDGFRCPRWDHAGLFGRRSPWMPAREVKLDGAARRAFERVTATVRDMMRSLGTSRDAFGLVHGDLTQANYVFHANSVAPIDFGDFGRGYFLYDAAVTLLMLKPFDRSGAQRRAFINGYREFRRLTRDHEAMLDTFIAARAVVLSRWALGVRRPDAGNLRWVAQTLPWLVEFASRPRTRPRA